MPERLRDVLDKMTNRGRHQRATDDRGQSLVEFALIVPVMLLLLVAVSDFVRIYTTMTTVEAAAREAADYGGFDSTFWTEPEATRAEMRRRACIAASRLPDYAPKGGPEDACTNPEIVSMRVLSAPGVDAIDEGACVRSENPCWVEVRLRYRFKMLAPVALQFFDVRIGFPSELMFERTSTFAMGDLTFESQSPPPGTPGPGTEPTDAPTEPPSASPEPSASASDAASASPDVSPSTEPSAPSSSAPAPSVASDPPSPSPSPSPAPSEVAPSPELSSVPSQETP